jgi:hypothetical protein
MEQEFGQQEYNNGRRVTDAIMAQYQQEYNQEAPVGGRDGEAEGHYGGHEREEQNKEGPLAGGYHPITGEWETYDPHRHDDSYDDVRGNEGTESRQVEVSGNGFHEEEAHGRQSQQNQNQNQNQRQSQQSRLSSRLDMESSIRSVMHDPRRPSQQRSSRRGESIDRPSSGIKI